MLVYVYIYLINLYSWLQGFYPKNSMDMMRCDYIADCFYEIMHDYMRYYHWKNGRFRVSQSFQYSISSFNTQQN